MGLRRDFLKSTTVSNSWMPTRNTVTLINREHNTTYTRNYSDYFDYSNRDTKYGDQQKWERLQNQKARHKHLITCAKNRKKRRKRK